MGTDGVLKVERQHTMRGHRGFQMGQGALQGALYDKGKDEESCWLLLESIRCTSL
jgi:hypothetical protein